MARKNGPRVLVVDDVADTADSCVLLLRLWGYEADACYAGSTALEAARAYPPQAVLLDIGMPGMDGFEVVRRLREQPALRHTVLVALTGYANEACRVRAQESGFQHFLVKPVDPDDLRELLLHVVGPLGFPKAPPADGRWAPRSRRTEHNGKAQLASAIGVSDCQLVTAVCSPRDDSARFAGL
jgi:two-component system, OmpR family, response regulator